MSETAKTLSSSRLRSFSLSETASIPSVSMTTVLLRGSRATQAPDVHEVWDADVEKTSCPSKKQWLREKDLPKGFRCSS